MGIFDITDSFCETIQTQDKNNQLGYIYQNRNKQHEQPIVTFLQKDNVESVIYREEL